MSDVDAKYDVHVVAYGVGGVEAWPATGLAKMRGLAQRIEMGSGDLLRDVAYMFVGAMAGPEITVRVRWPGDVCFQATIDTSPDDVARFTCVAFGPEAVLPRPDDPTDGGLSIAVSVHLDTTVNYGPGDVLSVAIEHLDKQREKDRAKAELARKEAAKARSPVNSDRPSPVAPGTPNFDGE